MNNATRASILFALLVPLGLVVHASDAPFMIAQTLPGQLPGQKPPGQLPGASPAPSKPATAASPSTSSALPGTACCNVTAINKTTGVVSAREKNGGRTIEIKATPVQTQNLRVGQDLFANLETKKASLDGKVICCDLIFAAAAPSALPAKTAGGLLAVPAPGMTAPTPAQPSLTTVPKQDARCASATMTSALFLKIDKIPGDSLDKCYRDEIELLGFTNSGNAITITKRIDTSTPRLFSAALQGLVMPAAILTVLESGAQRRILRYTMKNAVVNSIDQVAGSDNRETVQFRFSSLTTETETSTATAGSSSPRSIAVSFTLGPAQSAASALNSGVSTGRFQDFVVVKPLDASSPKLMQAKQSGQPIPEIVITLRSGSDSLTYRLSNVLIASDVQQGSGAGQSETVHLKPSKVMFEYNSGSRPGAAVKGGWDVKANTKV